MKNIFALSIILIIVGLNIQAQTLEDANKLYADKKYDVAAEIFFQHYRFNEAINAWQMQTDLLLNNKKPQIAAADSIKPLIARAQRAARMVARCENIQIIDSVIVDKINFLNVYLLGEESGTLVKTTGSIVYENPLKDRRYFGKKDETGCFRLNTQVKISEEWLEERPLNLLSDSTADDNFPFVLPDGLTIYYASTGNESIGGYDLYVSRYNMNTDSYLAPNQLGMPFNSIYNDYMLAIDEENEIGYFATDRFQPEDKIVVYTFIPQEEFKPLEIEDEQLLIDRAKINSIRDTWVQEKDYQAHINSLKNSIEKAQQKIRKDFTFVVNDNIVYYLLSEFDSDAAKKSFLESKNLKEKIDSLENQLDIQRQEYAQGNAGKKQSLTASILTNEKQLENLYITYKKTVTDARNLEIKYLRNKDKN
jgi:hypothetical protein